MIQYESYPIFVHYPDQDLLRTRYQEIAHHAKHNDFKKTAWIRNVGIPRDEIVVPGTKTNGPDGAAFESEVVKQLKKIESTAIGKVTMNSLLASPKVWILPLTDDDGKACSSCAASAYEAKAEAGGGIRIHFLPAEYRINNRWVANDDQLFHELAHSVRHSIGAWEKAQKVMDGYQSSEEFIATIMENVYISSKGGRTFYKEYPPGQPTATLNQAYEIYAGSAKILAALKFYTRNDPFLWAMARRTDPPYNPWRDQPALEKRWLARMASKGVKRLPEVF
jgi:hypothetical protein